MIKRKGASRDGLTRTATPARRGGTPGFANRRKKWGSGTNAPTKRTIGPAKRRVI